MKLRTIDGAYNEILAADSNTALTKYRIRELVIKGVIPSRKSGNKYLLDMDALTKYFQEGGCCE